MVERSGMWYVYFRFFTDESVIITGLERYCKEWENMYQIGYNYREYKCFVDDIGGFEHWVGDMHGYIAQSRETGFLDGAPSDGVFDQTLMMGVVRIITTDVAILDGFKNNTKFIFRKITGKDAGTDHKIDFVFSNTQKIKHPVMYTIDESRIEIVQGTTSKITDNSDITEYETTIDVNVALLTGILDSLTGAGATMTNFENMFDKNEDTYAAVTNSWGDGDATLVIDMVETFTCCAVDIYKKYDTGVCPSQSVNIEYSLDKTTWYELKNMGISDGRFIHSKKNIEGRYIRFIIDNYASCQIETKIYRLFCS